MKKQVITLLCLLLLPLDSAWSVEKQSPSEILRVATEFIREQTRNMPGKVSYKVEALDSRLSFPPCSQLEAYLPTGAQLRGRTSIGIRCNETNGWSLIVPASITTTMNMLVSSRPLQQGLVIGSGDFNLQAGELTHPGTITDEAQALGKVLKFSIGAGQVLKQDMLRLPYVVTQGQTVQLYSNGNGIQLRTEGQALNNAAEGQSAQVKVASGQVISGIAKGNGIVEVRP